MKQKWLIHRIIIKIIRSSPQNHTCFFKNPHSVDPSVKAKWNKQLIRWIFALIFTSSTIPKCNELRWIFFTLLLAETVRIRSSVLGFFSAHYMLRFLYPYFSGKFTPFVHKMLTIVKCTFETVFSARLIWNC